MVNHFVLGGIGIGSSDKLALVSDNDTPPYLTLTLRGDHAIQTILKFGIK